VMRLLCCENGRRKSVLYLLGRTMLFMQQRVGATTVRLAWLLSSPH
jgi:hypothetical protein